MNGVKILQRISDHLNWLTNDEASVVQKEYNDVVGLFFALERVLFATYGFDNVDINGTDKPEKKSVIDFMVWHDEGHNLAHDLMKFLVGCKEINWDAVSENDKDTVRHGWSKINGLDYAVVHMGVTVVNKDD